jgi:hypothetical protein
VRAGVLREYFRVDGDEALGEGDGIAGVIDVEGEGGGLTGLLFAVETCVDLQACYVSMVWYGKSWSPLGRFKYSTYRYPLSTIKLGRLILRFTVYMKYRCVARRDVQSDLLELRVVISELDDAVAALEHGVRVGEGEGPDVSAQFGGETGEGVEYWGHRS